MTARGARAASIVAPSIAALACVVALAGCSDNPPRPRQWTVDEPAKTDPPPPIVKPASHHASHEHEHGPHPHVRSDHHHHPHPHPHLAGQNGHHPY